MKIHKRHIASHVSKEHDIPLDLSQKIVQSVLDSIQKSLVLHGKLSLRGFGTWQIKERGKKVGRHPKTGERIDIPPTDIITFHPSDTWLEKMTDMKKWRDSYTSINNANIKPVYDTCESFVKSVVYPAGTKVFQLHATQQLLDYAGFDAKVIDVNGTCSGEEATEASKWLNSLFTYSLKMSEKDMTHYVADMVFAARKYKSDKEDNDVS